MEKKTRKTIIAASAILLSCAILALGINEVGFMVNRSIQLTGANQITVRNGAARSVLTVNTDSAGHITGITNKGSPISMAELTSMLTQSAMSTNAQTAQSFIGYFQHQTPSLTANTAKWIFTVPANQSWELIALSVYREGGGGDGTLSRIYLDPTNMYVLPGSSYPVDSTPLIIAPFCASPKTLDYIVFPYPIPMTPETHLSYLYAFNSAPDVFHFDAIIRVTAL